MVINDYCYGIPFANGRHQQIRNMPLQLNDTAIEYSSLLAMEQWKRRREQILKRDNMRCRNCGANSNLQVHHRQYHVCSKTNRKTLPWLYENKYLITLCRTCHELGHSKYRILTFKR